MTARRRIVALSASALALAAAAPAQSATSTDVRNFAKHCQTQSKKRVAGSTRTAFSTCITAMSRLARGRTRSPQNA